MAPTASQPKTAASRACRLLIGRGFIELTPAVLADCHVANRADRSKASECHSDKIAARALLSLIDTQPRPLSFTRTQKYFERFAEDARIALQRVNDSENNN